MKSIDNVLKNIPIFITMLLVYSKLYCFDYFIYRIGEPWSNRFNLGYAFYLTSEDTNRLLVYIYYTCLLMMAVVLIANIAFYLKDYTFACFKPLLALFDKNYQDTKALYKGLGYIFIADIILVPVLWKISSLLDYNAINENLLRSSDGQNKVQVMTATASTVFAWISTPYIWLPR